MAIADTIAALTKAVAAVSAAKAEVDKVQALVSKAQAVYQTSVEEARRFHDEYQKHIREIVPAQNAGR